MTAGPARLLPPVVTEAPALTLEHQASAHALVRRTVLISFDRGDVEGAIAQLRAHVRSCPECPSCWARSRRRRGIGGRRRVVR